LGAAFAHSSGKPEYGNGEGDGKLESNDVTVYATNLRDNGQTIDIVGRVGRLDSDFTTALGDKADFKNWAASLGVEYGKKWAFGEHFSVEPQAQLTYHYIWGDDFTTRNGIKVTQSSTDSLVGRLGVVAGFDWTRRDDYVGRIYAKASVLHDFLGDVDNTLSQDVVYTDNESLGDTWYVVDIGTNVKVGKAWSLYLDAETSLNAQVKTKYNLNAGVRYAF